jgi:hypothetical protein
MASAEAPAATLQGAVSLFYASFLGFLKIISFVIIMSQLVSVNILKLFVNAIICSLF